MTLHNLHVPTLAMRILMVSNDFLPNPGGIAAHVYELSCALARLGHDVDLVVGHNRIHEETSLPQLPQNARILRNRSFTWSTQGKSVMACDTALFLRRICSENAYDICHWHNLTWETATVAFGARPLPRVFTNHSSGFLRRAKIGWRKRFQLPAILSTAHSIITPSRELLERTAYIGYPRENIEYIPNGVDVNFFCEGQADPALQARYGIEPRHRVIIAPRRLDAKNGIDVLIKAAAQVIKHVPELRVLLVGDGDQRNPLLALVEQLGLSAHIVFCGSQARNVMPNHLRLAELAVLPSRAEAVSLAGLEAMATGLPVIGSNVGGIPEFVLEGETGRLVPVDDPNTLATALIEMLGTPPHAIKTIGTRARDFVTKNFSWHSCALATADVYERAMRLRCFSR